MGSNNSHSKSHNQFTTKHRSCSVPASHTIFQKTSRVYSDDESSEDQQDENTNQKLKGHITYLPQVKGKNCFVIEFHMHNTMSNSPINILSFASYTSDRRAAPSVYSRLRSCNNTPRMLHNSHSIKGSDCLKTQETKNSANFNDYSNDVSKNAKSNTNMLTALYPIKEVPDDINSQRCSSTYRSICESHEVEHIKQKKISKGISGCNRMISLSKQK